MKFRAPKTGEVFSLRPGQAVSLEEIAAGPMS